MNDKISKHYAEQAAKMMESKECGICGEQTEPLAGNPMRWPVDLPYIKGNGKLKSYHMGCVSKAVQEYKDK